MIYMIKYVIPILFGIFSCVALPAAPPSFAVNVTGKGKPMILIPGLSSSGHVWDGTVAHLKDRYEMHVLTLAGFAGQPRIEDPFLETVRNDLAAYIRKNKLDKPVIVGHSLGGFLALWLASHDPDLVGPLVIVDSLPFLPAVYNPAATAESGKAMAEQMRAGMLKQTEEERLKAGEQFVRPMVTSAANFEIVSAWSKTSDIVAIANAMHDMFATDLRADVARITSPTIVIGTWIGYKEYATRDVTEKNFETQYALLKGHELILSDTARHFVMLDDPEWFYRTLDRFLAPAKPRS